MSIQQLFQSLAERLQRSASVKTVYGDPIVAEGKTIIPVARVAYGFGGGSGSQKVGSSKKQNPGEEGEGGGGGVAASPVGVVEITREDTRFISLGSTKKVAGALIAGLLAGILIGRRRPSRALKE